MIEDYVAKVFMGADPVEHLFVGRGVVWCRGVPAVGVGPRDRVVREQVRVRAPSERLRR